MADLHRWMLRPGLHVVLRDEHTVQVGLDGGVVLARTPSTDAVLGALATGAPVPDGDDADRVLADLVARAVVVQPAPGGAAVSAGADARAAVSAVIAEHGHDAPAVLQRRRTARVGVVGQESVAPVSALLAPTGIDVTGLDTTETEEGPAPDVVVVVGLGEPHRDTLDPLVRDSCPHVLVTAVDGRVRVGPFVVPGRTACVRCIDAHHADRDPRRPLLVEQYAVRSGAVRADGVEHPVPPTTWQLAIATAADEVVRFIDGELPLLWSSTLALGGADHTPVRWLRHPRCGCTWGEGLAVG